MQTLTTEHAPGELPPVYLKVSFPVGRRGVDREWMWVQVVRWETEVIEGVLASEPRARTDLRAGAYVAFTRGQVADFQRQLEGDRFEGNALRRMLHGGLYSPVGGGNMRGSVGR